MHMHWGHEDLRLQGAHPWSVLCMASDGTVTLEECSWPPQISSLEHRDPLIHIYVPSPVLEFLIFLSSKYEAYIFAHNRTISCPPLCEDK